MSKKIKISFKPKAHTDKFLSALKDRTKKVVVDRYGLGPSHHRKTLESIGKELGITRERVRQIENYGIKMIRKSSTFAEARAVFDEMKSVIDSLGGVVSEDSFLSMLSSEKKDQNHFHFYLVLGDEFGEIKEDKQFKKRWFTKREMADVAHGILEDIYTKITKKDLLTEEEIVSAIKSHQHMEMIKEKVDESVVLQWLDLSKKIQKNPLNEWGRHDSPNVSVRGVKDYAYLVMRKNGSPLHFREVAEAIKKDFGKKVHTATCHNELIRDDRFVLVGRGLYALKQWGYKPGVVKDVIQEILTRESRPMTKEEIIDRVSKERYLKTNTILVNLQSNPIFQKDSEGRYFLAN